jgi:hypothetical protein
MAQSLRTFHLTGSGPYFAGVLLLANSRIKGLEGQAYGIQTYILWLQFSLVSVFALSYALAMIKR